MPRKVFVAGEILTAADVNTNLMDQAVMVFDTSAARGSAIPSPSEGMVTYLKDEDKIQQYTTDWEDVGRQGIGPNAVQTVKTNVFSASLARGTETEITGLTATITPSTDTAKVLVIAQVSVGAVSTALSATLNLFRGVTALMVGDSDGVRTRRTTAAFVSEGRSQQGTIISFLDSPATTSPVTYSIKLGSMDTSSVQTFFVNRATTDDNNDFTTRTASSITVIEVAV